MKKQIFITVLMITTLCFGQKPNIVQNDNYNGKNSRFEKALIDAVVANALTGKDQYITPPKQWTVSGFNKITKIDTVVSALKAQDVQKEPGYFHYNKKSVVVWHQSIDTILVKGLDGKDYIPYMFKDSVVVSGLDNSSFYTQALLNRKSRIKSIKVNGQDYTTNNSFNAVLQSDGWHRLVRKITGLKSGIDYTIVIVYENEFNEEIEAHLFVKTLSS